jgi:hypothetical protein
MLCGGPKSKVRISQSSRSVITWTPNACSMLSMRQYGRKRQTPCRSRHPLQRRTALRGSVKRCLKRSPAVPFANQPQKYRFISLRIPPKTAFHPISTASHCVSKISFLIVSHLDPLPPNSKPPVSPADLSRRCWQAKAEAGKRSRRRPALQLSLFDHFPTSAFLVRHSAQRDGGSIQPSVYLIASALPSEPTARMIALMSSLSRSFAARAIRHTCCS